MVVKNMDEGNPFITKYNEIIQQNLYLFVESMRGDGFVETNEFV